jgi:hypothetical protein
MFMLENAKRSKDTEIISYFESENQSQLMDNDVRVLYKDL